jgi:hypothetical protein
MKSRHISKRVRQSVLTWIIGVFIVLLAVGYLGAITVMPYFRAMARGPVEFSPRQLNNHNGTTLYFVQIEGPEIFDTGFEYTSSQYGIQTEHWYYGALVVGNKFLIVEIGSAINPEQLSYLGTLENASQAIQTKVIGAIVEEQPELEGYFLPYVLKTGDAYNIWWFLGGIVWLFALVGCMWLLYTNTHKLGAPQQDEMLKTLSRYGDMEEVAVEIEGELFGTEPVRKVEKLKLTKNWLIDDRFAHFEAFRLDSIVWYYKHITQHYINGIPSGKTISLYIHDATGKKVAINGSMKQVDVMLRTIYELTPWAIAGFTEQIKQGWDFQRASLVAAVEERKAEILKEASKAS